MTLPVGALSATLTVSAPIDVAGTVGTIVSLHVRPEVPAGLVWAATGVPVEPWPAQITPGTAPVPVTSLALEILADQPGVLTSGTLDGAPQMVAIRSWPLVATWMTRQGATGAPTKHVRRLSAPAPGSTVDLDLLPQGGALPVATVTTAQSLHFGLASIVDNGDGTLDLSGALVTDPGDGTLTIGA